MPCPDATRIRLDRHFVPVNFKRRQTDPVHRTLVPIGSADGRAHQKTTCANRNHGDPKRPWAGSTGRCGTRRIGIGGLPRRLCTLSRRGPGTRRTAAGVCSPTGFGAPGLRRAAGRRTGHNRQNHPQHDRDGRQPARFHGKPHIRLMLHGGIPWSTLSFLPLYQFGRNGQKNAPHRMPPPKTAGPRPGTTTATPGHESPNSRRRSEPTTVASTANTASTNGETVGDRRQAPLRPTHPLNAPPKRLACKHIQGWFRRPDGPRRTRVTRCRCRRGKRVPVEDPPSLASRARLRSPRTRSPRAAS